MEHKRVIRSYGYYGYEDVNWTKLVQNLFDGGSELFYDAFHLVCAVTW
jgi:hypothetical protein